MEVLHPLHPPRYINNPRDALKEFNFTRTDTKWGAKAIMHMVEIYMNPDNDAVWEEKENADTPESREAVATARSLLSQVRSPGEDGSEAQGTGWSGNWTLHVGGQGPQVARYFG